MLNKVQDDIAKLYNLYSLVCQQQKVIHDKFPHASKELEIDEHRKMIFFMAERIKAFWGINGFPQFGDLGTEHEKTTDN